MKKWFIGLLLLFIAVFIWVPLWMLLSGTLMGAGELSSNLARYVAHHCKLPDFAGICGTAAGYASILHGILEFL